VGAGSAAFVGAATAGADAAEPATIDPDEADRILAETRATKGLRLAGRRGIAFDPANGFCPTDAHVRVAVGLDSLGAASVRGTRYGQGVETLAVAIKVGQ